jgi:hypothetical protein
MSEAEQVKVKAEGGASAKDTEVPPMPVALSGTKVSLVSKSGTKYEIARELAEISPTWKAALKKAEAEDEDDEDEDEDEDETGDRVAEIQVRTLDDATLKRVVNFLTYHHGKPYQEPEKPLKVNDINKVMLDEWDAKFLDLAQEPLRMLVEAAHSLEIATLVDASIVKVACQIKGYTEIQAREWFGLDVEGADSEKVLA